MAAKKAAESSSAIVGRENDLAAEIVHVDRFERGLQHLFRRVRRSSLGRRRLLSGHWVCRGGRFCPAACG